MFFIAIHFIQAKKEAPWPPSFAQGILKPGAFICTNQLSTGAKHESWWVSQLGKIRRKGHFPRHFYFLTSSRRLEIGWLDLLGYRRKQLQKNTLIVHGSQAKNCLPKMPLFSGQSWWFPSEVVYSGGKFQKRHYRKESSGEKPFLFLQEMGFHFFCTICHVLGWGFMDIWWRATIWRA